MKTKFGAIIVAGSGKLGGFTTSGNTSRSALKIKGNAIKVYSAKNNAAMNNFSLIAAAWKNLSASAKKLWDIAAQSHIINNYFVNSFKLTGYLLFQQLNNNLIRLNTPLITAVPAFNPVLSVTNLSVTSPSATSILLSFLPSQVPANHVLEIWATPALSPGRSHAGNAFRFIGSFPAAANSPVDVYALYSQAFFIYTQQSANILFQTRIVSTISGIASSFSCCRLNIIATTGTNYYISSSGNDANNGLSISTPWKTIAKVNSSTFLPGDSILFNKGDTWRGRLDVSSNGTSSNYIVYSNYGTGANPKILASTGILSWSNQGNNVWRTVSTVNDPFHDSGGSITGNVFFIKSDGTVNPGYRETSTANLNSEFKAFWLSNYLYVYATSNPSTLYSAVESSKDRSSIFLLDHEYIEINGIDMFYGQYAGVHSWWQPVAGKNGFILRNCEIAYNGYPNSGFGYGSMVTYNNTLIEHNTIHDCGRRGVSLICDRSITISNIVVQNNSFYNGNHTTGVDIIATDDGYTSNFENITIRNNTIDGTPADKNRCVPQLMFVANQTIAGGTVTNISIYNNIIKNSTAGGGIQMQKIFGANIFNNTFYEHNITDAAAFHLYFSDGCTNINVKNNIFYSSSSKTGAFGLAYYLPSTQSPTGINSDYNLYFRTSGSLMVIYTDLLNYYFSQQTAIVSALSWEEHSVFANPNFVSGSNLHLQAGSPCINAGVDVGLTVDIDGNPIVGIPDIGAFEYSTV